VEANGSATTRNTMTTSCDPSGPERRPNIEADRHCTVLSRHRRAFSSLLCPPAHCSCAVPHVTNVQSAHTDIRDDTVRHSARESDTKKADPAGTLRFRDE
jgi:hypothetical protein